MKEQPRPVLGTLYGKLNKQYIITTLLCTVLVNIKGKSVPVYHQLQTFLTTSAQYTLSAHG